ncbi:DgyrCDS2020 [Dimorphilus gyrociliatus]|uniref:DgyrCDS2020 n=1 Tax=Dimorphilus gyrociliatus TaxID=2664684 RepID=A0A7I8VE41_9ANNE|nr:DgyrCDS2020 [Dimorphilus gyrociliatus]
MTFNRIKRLYHYLVILWITLLVEPSKSTNICNANRLYECYCFKCKWPNCCNSENLGDIKRRYIEFSLKTNSNQFNTDLERKWQYSIAKSIQNDCNCTRNLEIVSVFVNEDFYRVVILSDFSQQQLLNSLNKTVFPDFSLVIKNSPHPQNSKSTTSSKYDFTVREWLGFVFSGIFSIIFIISYFVSCTKACLDRHRIKKIRWERKEAREKAREIVRAQRNKKENLMINEDNDAQVKQTNEGFVVEKKLNGMESEIVIKSENELTNSNGFIGRKPLTRFSSFGSSKQTNNNRQLSITKNHSLDSTIKSENGENLTGAFDNHSFVNDTSDKANYAGGFV